MKITAVEAVPLSIPFTYGAAGWQLGAGGWKPLDFSPIPAAARWRLRCAT